MSGWTPKVGDRVHVTAKWLGKDGWTGTVYAPLIDDGATKGAWVDLDYRGRGYYTIHELSPIEEATRRG